MVDNQVISACSVIARATTTRRTSLLSTSGILLLSAAGLVAPTLAEEDARERETAFVEDFASDVPPNLKIRQYYDIIVEARPKV